jgi:hypothetical protein
MKTQANILDKITNDHVNNVDVAVFAEWKMNNFNRTVNDNTPNEDDNGYDVELFPIESISMPHRPLAGICKAVVNQAYVEPVYHQGVPAHRFYVADQDDQYKYWQSPEPSGDVDSSGYTIANCAPQVTYVEEEDVADAPVPTTILVNKIHFTVETGYARPVDYDVQVKTTSAGSWTTVASDIAIPDDGLVELWYNGFTWTTTKNLAHTRTLYAVRLVINKMDTATAFFNLIELGLALELDISDDVVNLGDQESMGEADFITPLGNISSNTGSLVLFSDTNMYDKENEDSILYGLLDKGVKITAFDVYDGTDEVQEFKMFSNTWTQGDDDNVTVDLNDGTDWLQVVKPRAVLYENIPVQEAVWRICDVIGFTDYNAETLDETAQAVIDIFWTDGQKTAWELFGDLARASQTAIYFDSFGVLQIKTRDTAWDDTKPVSQTFLSTSVPGGQPANIVSVEASTQYEANRVTVNWKPTSFSEIKDNVIPFEVVWEPDGDVVLRASELKLPMTDTDTVINLTKSDGENWPFKGICQIEGEWISYEGKTYVYYDAGGSRQTTTIKDLESQQKLDAVTPALMVHLNHYTGQLIVTERGLYNTEAASHNIALTGWTKTRMFNPGTDHSPCSGIVLNQGKSTVSIGGPKRANANDFTFLHRGAKTDVGYLYMGFRMKIDKSSSTDKVGGLAFNMDGTGMTGGYYLDVMATKKMNGKVRAKRNEIILYSYKDDGSKKAFGGETVVSKDKSKNHPAKSKTKTDIGSEFAVVLDDYIDFDIIQNSDGDYIQVWANGKFLFDTHIDSGWKHDRVGRFGLYARGYSDVTFDYVYAISNPGIQPTDNEGYYDRITGAYRGNQWMLDWTYETRTVRRRIKKKWHKIQQKYNQRFYDEFGPVVHEIREFDVKFTNDTPSLQSKIYFSNSTQSACTEFTPSVYGAKFTMVNISRQNAVISGDDELTAKGNGTINQKLFVYGRPVIQKDALQVVKDDAWAQRRRGIIDIEYDSDWIQNQAEADRFSDWLTTHWSRSDQTLEVEVFGNPLVELTDVVHVTHNDIDDDFYVTAINNTFDSGLTTTLSLRKVG